MKKGYRVAYIVSRFPGLSETFILREMCEMERLEWTLDLYPLINQEEAVIHDEARDWMTRARQPSLLDILSANVKLLLVSPLLYLSTLVQSLLGNISSPKFLSRVAVVFPKAVWMARQMRLDKVGHVHSHYATHPALAAWIINQITGIPYGVTVHAHDIFVDKSMLYRKLLDANYIIAISEYNRDYLADLFGDWVLKKTHIVHCGIFTDMYAVKSLDTRNNRTFQLLSIGSLRTYKGFTHLLDACVILKCSGNKFQCRIIGDGELRESLKTKIRKLDIGDVVELVGPKDQKEVAKMLSEADCYIQPSIITPNGKMEGIPVSLMEAMASELPVIATKISGVPELVRHGETGWLVAPGDPRTLAETIVQVQSNLEEATKRARAGRELVITEFNVAITVRLLSNIFNETSKDFLWK